jgi:hypothetical protein
MLQVPGGGAASQDRQQAGLRAFQFCEEQVAEQVVVAVPLARRSNGTSSRFDRARSASVVPAPGTSSTASHSGPDIRSRTAVLVKKTRCELEIRARNSDSTYSLTNRSSPRGG